MNKKRITTVAMLTLGLINLGILIAMFIGLQSWHVPTFLSIGLAILVINHNA